MSLSPPNSYIEILTPSVMEVGLGGNYVMNGVTAHITGAPESSLVLFLLHKDKVSR